MRNQELWERLSCSFIQQIELSLSINDIQNTPGEPFTTENKALEKGKDLPNFHSLILGQEPYARNIYITDQGGKEDLA